MRGIRLDHTGLFVVGVPKDIGWGWALIRPDNTLTRWCKSCGVSVTTRYDPETRSVEPGVVEHKHWCAVAVGNNPSLS